MILYYFDLYDASSAAFFVFLGGAATAAIVGVTLHEFSHALVADRVGDPRPRRDGRLTVNPLAHFDPLGTPLFFIAGFGWGRSQQVPDGDIRIGSRVGALSVAAAGPLSHFLLAFIAGLPLINGYVPWLPPLNADVISRTVNSPAWLGSDYIGLFFSSVVVFSVVLGLFNLLPLPPLDGFRAAVALLPGHLPDIPLSVERWGSAILVLLLTVPLLFGDQFGGLFDLLDPAISELVGEFTNAEGVVFR